MRGKSIGWLLACLLLWTTAAGATTISIVPEPLHLTSGTGAFVLRAGERIATPADARAQWIAGYLRKHVAARTGVDLAVAAGSSTGAIVLRIDPAIKGKGAYELAVTPAQVTLTAADDHGLFWAVQTLRQLLPARSGAALSIPAVQIRDAPRYPWRGVMLDVSRRFYPVDFVKRQIALMSYYKFNVFHWHLTDDQGWRIEIPQYPRLTSVGGWRSEADGQRSGGYYTAKEIRDVVEYARERNVMVVPEIEMPGHSSAAIAAYPELSCSGKPIDVPTSWGVLRNIDCVGKPAVFTFMQNVLDEVTKLFPSPYVNIGGDEVPAGVWDDCTACAALAKAHGFKDDEPDLHGYFIGQIDKYLASKGKTLIGWDEILEGGVSPNAIVEVWHGPQFAAQAMAGGNRVIVAWPFYLDTPINDMTLEDLYRNDPFNDPLLTRYPDKVLGGEAPLWSDHTPYSPDALMYPRLLAIAEHLWNPAANDWKDFLGRVRAQETWLAAQHVAYGPDDADVADYHVSFHRDYKRWRLRVARGFDDLRMHYTLDGSAPTASSPAFVDRLDLRQPATLRVAPFRGNVAWSTPVTFRFVDDLALGASVEATAAPIRGNAAELTDGILGKLGPHGRYSNWRWTVWPDSGMQATIDLGKPTAIHSIEVRFLQASGYGAEVPDRVVMEGSTDGTHWLPLGTEQPHVGFAAKGLMRVYPVENKLAAAKDLRYVRIVATEQDPAHTRVYADEVIVL